MSIAPQAQPPEQVLRAERVRRKRPGLRTLQAITKPTRMRLTSTVASLDDAVTRMLSLSISRTAAPMTRPTLSSLSGLRSMRKGSQNEKGGQSHDFSSGLRAGAGENEGAGAGAGLGSDLGVGTAGQVRFGSDSLDAGAEGNVGFTSNLDMSVITVTPTPG